MEDLQREIFPYVDIKDDEEREYFYLYNYSKHIPIYIYMPFQTYSYLLADVKRMNLTFSHSIKNMDVRSVVISCTCWALTNIITDTTCVEISMQYPQNTLLCELSAQLSGKQKYGKLFRYYKTDNKYGIKVLDIDNSQEKFFIKQYGKDFSALKITTNISTLCKLYDIIGAVEDSVNRKEWDVWGESNCSVSRYTEYHKGMSLVLCDDKEGISELNKLDDYVLKILKPQTAKITAIISMFDDDWMRLCTDSLHLVRYKDDVSLKELLSLVSKVFNM